MRTGARSFVRSLLAGLVLCLVLAVPAFAQDADAPAEPDAGICAPWHRCMALGAVGMTVLTLGALGVGYLIQSKGFDSVEHRMGTPQGAPVKKD